ncbi:MAG: Ig-like domain-containing protein [Vicinamibacteria bacterium]
MLRPSRYLPSLCVARVSIALVLGLVPMPGRAASGDGSLPDPFQLPIATTLQVPLTAVYSSLGVPALPAGSHYLDPTTLVKVHKITSGSFPAASPRWGHDYSEGGDEVSLPYAGDTRAVLVRQNGGAWWLVDFTPGVGVGNPRQLSGSLAPMMDLAFTFSNNPATPYYAYVSSGSVIRRFDIRTMAEAPGGGWPVTGETSAMWLHQSENDGFFTWMRGANGSTIVGYEPASGVRKTYTNSNLNEPRIDRAGRYVGISMSGNGLVVWDWLTNAVAWSMPGDPGIPFAHNASLKRRFMSVDWNMSYPPDYTVFTTDAPGSAAHAGGPANGTLIHGNGNWIQQPADLDDQWAVFLHYGSLRPAESYWLSPGGMVLVTPRGERRLLAHPYNTSSDYAYYSFAKFSPDGRYVMFTSDMNGSGRSDVFLAELPAGADATPPSVSLTAPLAGAVVSGIALTVSASASDDVGVAGVRFQLDGRDLGPELTSAPYSLAWDTTSTANGLHGLTARARDAAGNWTDSASAIVSVLNLDLIPPVISWVSASNVTAAEATIAWTTNEAADSQVEYGTSTGYGLATTLEPGLVTSHAARLGGLAADTAYHYRLKSRDAAGNLAVSSDYAFVTQKAASSGLVAQLALDEGTGSLAADASGNGNTGALRGGAAWVAGRSGQAVSFDGLDDHVGVAHASSLNAFPLSVSVWFKSASASGVRGIVNKYVGGSYDGYQIFLNDGTLCAWYLRDASNYVYDGGGCTLGTPGLNDDRWHHAVFVVDAQGGRLYVDGSPRGAQPWTGSAGPVTTSQELRLGHYPGAFGGAEFLNGAVDDLRVYARALTGPEIAGLYAAAPADTTAPVVSLVAPTGGQVVSGSIAVSASASDESGVAGVQFVLDGLPLQGEDTAAPFSVDWNTVLVSNGSHVLAAVARDAAGNQATSAPVTLTVSNDVTPPLLAGVAASNLTATGATIAWTSSEPADGQVEYGATTAYGSTTTLATGLVTSHAQALGGLASATTYHYRVKSRDAAGNLATSADFSFTTAASSSAPQPVQWSGLVRVTATGNNLRKTAGCDGCADAGARSVQTIGSAGGYLELTASETASMRYIGLSKGNPGTSANEIKYALRLQSGWVEVRESGVYKADTPFATGDVLRVAVEAGVVKYYKNGGLFYTSSAAPSYPLLVDTSLYSLNATLTNVLIRR